MALSLKCPGCQSVLKIPDKARGKTVKCPKCKKPLKIPAPTSTPPSPSRKKVEAKPNPAPIQSAVSKPKACPPEEVHDEDMLDLVDEVEEIHDDTGLDMVEDEVMDAADLDMLDEGGEEADDDISSLIIPKGADPFEGIDIGEEDREDMLNELTKTERILWIGFPSARIRDADFQTAKWIAIPLCSVFILVGSILAVVGSVKGIVGLALSGGIFALFATAFVFLFLKFGRGGASPDTYYLLTNRRAILWTRMYGMGDQVESYTAADLGGMKRKDHRKIKGAGDLIFATKYVEGVGSNSGTQKVDVGFKQLENVRRIEHLVRRVLIEKLVDWMVQ